MSEPAIGGKNSIIVNLEKGKEYAYCTCGRSGKQPFCDGSHGGTEFRPMIFTAEEDGPQHLCPCKRTKTPPYCDDSHKDLPDESEKQ